MWPRVKVQTVNEKKLEIACFNSTSAFTAYESGADRIEFCKDKKTDGLSPETNDFIFIRKKIQIPIYVMIRCREGNFVYSKNEIEAMSTQLRQFKNLGADGFVFGCLNERNQIEKSVCQKLIDVAFPLPCTFHRAFDKIENRNEGIQEIEKLGFKAILSSGGNSNAIDNIAQLKVTLDTTRQIDLIAGGGIRSENIETLLAIENLNWIHSSAIINNSELASAEEIEKIKSRLKT